MFKVPSHADSSYPNSSMDNVALSCKETNPFSVKYNFNFGRFISILLDDDESDADDEEDESSLDVDEPSYVRNDMFISQ